MRKYKIQKYHRIKVSFHLSLFINVVQHEAKKTSVRNTKSSSSAPRANKKYL